jgi:hypothetical protein
LFDRNLLLVTNPMLCHSCFSVIVASHCNTLFVNFSHMSQERQTPDEARPAKLCLVSAVDVGSAMAFIYIGVWYSVHSFRSC